jgi:hypothetical protein
MRVLDGSEIPLVLVSIDGKLGGIIGMTDTGLEKVLHGGRRFEFKNIYASFRANSGSCKLDSNTLAKVRDKINILTLETIRVDPSFEGIDVSVCVQRRASTIVPDVDLGLL